MGIPGGRREGPKTEMRPRTGGRRERAFARRATPRYTSRIHPLRQPTGSTMDITVLLGAPGAGKGTAPQHNLSTSLQL